MYLLYSDGSGSVRNPSERHFVLAGIAVFDRQIYHFVSNVDKFVSLLALGDTHDVELHGSVMVNESKTPWKGMVRKHRLDTIERSLGLLVSAHHSVKAFAVAVDKQSIFQNDPVEYAFEEICNRFNLFLSRLYRRGGAFV